MGPIVSAFVEALKQVLKQILKSGMGPLFNTIKGAKKAIHLKKELKIYKTLSKSQKSIVIRHRLAKNLKQRASARISQKVADNVIPVDYYKNEHKVNKNGTPYIKRNWQRRKVHNKVQAPLARWIDWLFKTHATPKSEEIFIDIISKSKGLRDNFNEVFGNASVDYEGMPLSEIDSQSLRNHYFNGRSGPTIPSMVIAINSSWILWAIYRPIPKMKGYGTLTIKIREQFKSKNNPSLIYTFGTGRTLPMSQVQWNMFSKSLVHAGTVFWAVYFRWVKLIRNTHPLLTNRAQSKKNLKNKVK